MVELSIYDTAGRLVVELVNETLPAGRHQAVWNGLNGRGRPVESGVYFARLGHAGGYLTRKLVLVR